MARRSLKPQLNQIRAWVRQGRTDAWIAHQLEVSATELREFRKQNGFTPDDEDEDDEKKERSGGEGGGDRPKRRRRRGRRGGRGRRKDLEATFDHGETDGYGLWLDPAVKDNPVYAEHWAGKREVTVRIDADQIVIRRPGAPEPEGESDDSGD